MPDQQTPKHAFSTLRGDLDTRPGHYYVVSHRQGSDPAAGYHRLAGPWPTHKEADDQVHAVQQFAERHGGQEAFFQHYITARVEVVDGEAAPTSRLGSNDRVWKGSTPTQEEIAIYLSKHRDFRGIMPMGLSVLVCRDGGTTLCPVALLTEAERAYDSSRGKFTREEREDARQLGIQLPVDVPSSANQILGTVVAKAKRRSRRP